MGFGFELQERFEGTFYFLDAPFEDRALRFSLRIGVDGMRRFVRDKKAIADGVVYAEGLAEGDGEGRPASGTITVKLFDEKRIPYDLAFEADDGRVYRLRGQRDFFVHDAVDSLTILPLSLYDDDGREVGRATLRFDPKTELPHSVRSFRLRVPGLSRSRIS